jgi:hypothetical protein
METIELMSDGQIIAVLADTDDKILRASATQELRDRYYKEDDIDAEVDRLYDERRRDTEDFHRYGDIDLRCKDGEL